MQLVEQGKLSLDADINQYLDTFQIPATFPEPITLRHLMTHTAGFEDIAYNGSIFAPDAESILPLGEFVANKMPARVRAPGKMVAYSNYGASLAGYIVQVVSGMPFEQYVAQNILEPLEMSRSTFEQPLPSNLAGDMALGYTGTVTDLLSPNARLKPMGFEFLNAFPGGGLSATATDMAHFMIAHLQNGRYKDARILQESTALEMHRQQYAFDPRIGGMTFGFHELNRNGLRALWHSGNTYQFYSLLVIIPEKNVGLFVSYNSRGGDKARWLLYDQFINRYFPTPAEDAPQVKPEAQDLARFEGAYLPTQMSWTTFERFFQLAGSTVSANPDGTLTVDTFSDNHGNEIRWEPVAPLLFRKVGGQDLLAFQEDNQGRITAMQRDSRTSWAYERAPWFRERVFQLFLVGVCVLIFIVTGIPWPFGFVVRWLRRKTIALNPRREQARALAGLVSLINLVVVIGFMIGISDTMAITYSLPPILVMSLVLGVVSVIGTAGLVFFAALAWQKGYWGLWSRITYTIVTVVAVAWVWFMSEWNLMSIPL